MSIELLEPRYLVIAEDTSGNFKKGDILVLDDEMNVFWSNRQPFTEEKLKEYPHLFRLLFWHEERKVEDMPEYIKFTRNYHSRKKGEIVKVLEYGEGVFLVGTKEPLRIEYFNVGSDTLPATESEFSTYQSSLK